MKKTRCHSSMKESRDFADMESLRHRASTKKEKGLGRIKASPEEKPHLT